MPANPTPTTVARQHALSDLADYAWLHANQARAASARCDGDDRAYCVARAEYFEWAMERFRRDAQRGERG